MELRISHDGLRLTDEQREFCERRLRFALSRFALRVERVEAVFSDVNGPKGGPDMLCCLQVGLRGAEDVLVRDAGESVEAVMAGAADRAARTVARRLQRRVDQRRSSRSDAAVGM
ncbi:MAG: hypothetical protein RL215_1013, partial [Planctomycetota bacterium]